ECAATTSQRQSAGGRTPAWSVAADRGGAGRPFVQFRNAGRCPVHNLSAGRGRDWVLEGIAHGIGQVTDKAGELPGALDLAAKIDGLPVEDVFAAIGAADFAVELLVGHGTITF